MLLYASPCFEAIQIIIHQVSDVRTSVCTSNVHTLVLLYEVVEIFRFLLAPYLNKKRIAKKQDKKLTKTSYVLLLSVIIEVNVI